MQFRNINTKNLLTFTFILVVPLCNSNYANFVNICKFSKPLFTTKTNNTKTVFPKTPFTFEHKIYGKLIIKGLLFHMPINLRLLSTGPRWHRIQFNLLFYSITTKPLYVQCTIDQQRTNKNDLQLIFVRAKTVPSEGYLHANSVEKLK